MSQDSNDDNTQSNQIGIIQTVKTPLGFFTLTVLVVEAILGITANFSQGIDRTYLIVGMLGLIFALVLIVAIFSFIRPEALKGLRPEKKAESPNLILDGLSASQKIAKYKELIEQETKNNLLINFNTPEGYQSEISTVDEFPFGFCYPENWVFSKFPQQINYGFALDKSSPKEIEFGRNMNVIISVINHDITNLDEFYDYTLNSTLNHVPNSSLIFKEDNFILQGLHAMRYRINWASNEADANSLSLYQVLVLDKNQKSLFIISFTTTVEDFETSRKQFDNIINTFRI